MKSKTLEELAEEAVDNALKNIEISGVHFRQFVEKFGNANENTKCNLSIITSAETAYTMKPARGV